MMSTAPAQHALKLERALGITSSSNASFCSAPSGDLFYAAGCFVVKYNPEDNKQKGFYKGSKAVSSIAVSGDGKFLAVGERGQTPLITIWSVERFEILTTLSAHKHGVGCMEFSPDGKFLVTVGYKLDRQLILWEWKTNQKLSVQKLGNRVHAVSFHCSGEFFVTAGDRHLKWWTINEVLEGEAVSLEGKAASILEDMRNSVFMDVICGTGSCDSTVYCTTSTGVLCLFNGEKMVEKWVQLESASSFCLELFAPDGVPGLLIVGCANGTIRCFDPKSLQYIATLPLPAPLLGAMPRVDGPDRDSSADELATHAMYAACYGVCKVSGGRSTAHPKLATIYADRSLFVWDISDLYAISKFRSFQFHRACVWDVQFIEGSVSQGDTGSSGQTPPLPKGTFVTCSADNTLRFWNTDQRLQRSSKFRSPHSREMLHCIDLLADVEPSETDDAQNTSIATTATRGEGALNSSISMTHYFAQQSNSTVDLDICEGVPDLELPDRPQSKYSPRTLAVHPDAHELACGDKMGTLMIFDIRGMRQISATPAHAAEILALSYSPVLVQDAEGAWSLREGVDEAVSQKEAVLLASAGRDRLIHVFNSTERYVPIQTLDHHTSSVTIAKFTSDGRRFLSCGGDRKMVFSSVNGPNITHLKSVTTPLGTINGLAVEASNKFAVSSGQDKRLNIWNVHTGKHMRAYRSEHVHSELYKSDIDPSGTYIATCAFDKTISIFDFFSGELVTQVSGHSELVTGVKFSPDGRHLISIGGDGCIFMWKVADSLVKAMQDRLMELMTNAQRRNMKAVAAVRKSHVDGMQMHHDVPPLPAPTFGTPGGEAAPAASVPPLPAATPMAESMESKGSSGAGHKSRWTERVENEHGYELFGKKIDPTATPDRNKNKFTLELTSTTRANLISEESAASGLGMEASRRVAALEDEDQVMCSAMSGSDTEDEGDGSELFKPAASGESQATEEYASDFETPTGDSAADGMGGPDLDRTHDVIEGLEKSVEDMDNWLANMVRGEGKLDEAVAPVVVTAVAVGAATVEVAEDSCEVKKTHSRRVVNKVTGEISARPIRTGDGTDMLDRSLSSAFFQNLHRNEGKHQANVSAPPTQPPASVTAADTAAQIQERKQRDTAAAVAQMRERLKVMGILEGTKKIVDNAAATSSDVSPRTPATSSTTTGNSNKATVSKQQHQRGQDDGYETASTASEPDDEPSDPLERSARIAHKISEKASQYRKILRELEIAKRKAAESFQELSGLRHSLDKSMRESTVLRSKHQRAPSTASIPEDDVLDVSMAQVDELMMQFQDSLHGQTQSRRSTSIAIGHSSGSSGLGFSRSTDSAQLDVEDVGAFLEKYSDKLAAMVGDKILNKMNSSMK